MNPTINDMMKLFGVLSEGETNQVISFTQKELKELITHLVTHYNLNSPVTELKINDKTFFRYALIYTFQSNDYGFDLWAESMDDMSNRVEALKETIEISGQLFSPLDLPINSKLSTNKLIN